MSESWARDVAAALPSATTAQSVEAVRDADVCVVHIDLVNRAGGLPSCPVIAVMPGASVTALLDLMDVSPNIVAAAFVDSAEAVAALARRVAVEPTGLAELLPGAEIHSRVVRDVADKTRSLAQIAQHASGMRVESIEQCVDEMLMNALYDAPVGERGEHLFVDVPVSRRVTMRTDRSVLVQYARADKRLVVLVRDAFGSLSRSTVVRHLQKAASIEHKLGGAGLGLFLMTTAASSVMFHVVAGVATTVICTFDHERPQLEQLGFVEHDAAGRAKTPAARVINLRRRRRVMASATIIALAAITMITWSRMRASRTGEIRVATTPGAIIELDGRRVGTAVTGTVVARDLVAGRVYRAVVRMQGYETKRAIVQVRAGDNAIALTLQPVAAVEIDSQPHDALVEVDGKARGTTPMELTTFAPDSTLTITLSHAGYRTATMHVHVPQRGRRRRVARTLEAMDDAVVVHFTSTPSGAAIVREGEPLAADRTYTPADVFVQAGQLQRFELVMPGYQRFVIEPFTPARGQRVEKSGALIPTQ